MRSRTWFLIIAVQLPGVAQLGAQLSGVTPAAPPPRPNPWSGSAEGSLNLLQGNADRRTLSAKLELDHADRSFSVRSSLRFIYSDGRQDSLPRRVDRRTWVGSLAFDYRPKDMVSPFAFVNYETSYEKRILDRIGLGIGAKRVISGKSTRTNASVSLALLSERTRPSRASSDTSTVSIL